MPFLALSCLLQYLQLCAEGPNPQALQDTLPKLIPHLSSGADRSNSDGSSTIAGNSST